jgi:uncharacterized protein YheU (UPF0270 family)
MKPQPEQQPGVRISPEDLDPETLWNVLEECVTRDGTELTDARAKIEQAMEQLRRGNLVLWFDSATRTCSLARSDR